MIFLAFNVLCSNQGLVQSSPVCGTSPTRPLRISCKTSGNGSHWAAVRQWLSPNRNESTSRPGDGPQSNGQGSLLIRTIGPYLPWLGMTEPALGSRSSGRFSTGYRAVVTRDWQFVRKVSENWSQTILNGTICRKWVESRGVRCIGATPYATASYDTALKTPRRLGLMASGADALSFACFGTGTAGHEISVGDCGGSSARCWPCGGACPGLSG
jgi:hypothetical protein